MQFLWTKIRGDRRFDHVEFSYLPGVPVLHDVTSTRCPPDRGPGGAPRRRQDHSGNC